MSWLSRVLPVVLASLVIRCGGESSIDPAKQKAYATELLNRGLYAEAAQAYDRYVDLPGVAEEERAKVLFHTANALFDQAKDYHGALIRYLRLRSFYPGFPRLREVDARIIECFERTGRSLEAQLALEQTADPSRKGQSARPAGAVVVAEIGSRVITERDLGRELGRLPPEIRQQFVSPEGRREFLRQLVGRELLYDMAVRRGYRDDPEVERQVEEVRRDLLVKKVVEEHIGEQPEISDTEVRLYYEAHKDQLKAPNAASPPPFEQVRPAIERAVRQMKQQEEIQKLLDRALSAEQVRLYPERLR